MVRRQGISRNSVRKYLGLLASAAVTGNATLAEQAYTSDSLMLDAHLLQVLETHFQFAVAERSKSGVTRQLLCKEYITQHPVVCLKPLFIANT